MASKFSLSLAVAVLPHIQVAPATAIDNFPSAACVSGDEVETCQGSTRPSSQDHLLFQVSRTATLAKSQRSFISSCCGTCAGVGFCSPTSGDCYNAKSKSYYESCAVEDPAPPAPTPSEGGLVPPTPPPGTGIGNCCSRCSAFCSPLSGGCKESRSKPYYLSCTGEGGPTYDTLVWSDDFDDVNGDGTVNSSKWSYWNGGNYNRELQDYTGRPDNSRVEDGKLKIIGKCEEYGSLHYTSARLVTENLGDWGPGHRIEVRAKLPNGKGVWPAVWMMPTESAYGGWPKSGEIDIMENVGCTRGSVYGTIHTESYNHMKNTQKGRTYKTDETDWHTYSIEWEGSYIHWYADGNHYNTFAPDTSSSDRWPFDRKFYLILNVAVGGNWGGFCLKGRDPSCSDPDYFGINQVMEIDYVHVYASSIEAGVLSQTM